VGKRPSRSSPACGSEVRPGTPGEMALGDRGGAGAWVRRAPTLGAPAWGDSRARRCRTRDGRSWRWGKVRRRRPVVVEMRGKAITMHHGPEARGTRSMWWGIIVLLAAVLLASAGPSDARGGHHRGGGHHGVRGHHGFRHPHVFVGVVPFGIAPFWSPNWPPYDDLPYGYPPVMIPPAPPPTSWYYCDDPPGYYPYVPQCPGGWRQVPATPP
jgi:hypothetical protein